jgi:alginate O-acetyltransferase complex protein AlgI
MLFNSVTFILFLAIVLALNFSPLSWSTKKTNLLLASYLFYAAWNPPFILLLAISTVVDWKVAQRIAAARAAATRKHWLWLSLGLNLGMLGVFKYSGFLLENFSQLMSLLGIDLKFADPGLILPMGISFYTFQTLSYTLDVYYRRMDPWHSFKDYALYVSFFPQLVAGPIVRASFFLPQTLKQPVVTFSLFSMGLALLIIGLFEKTVLADALFAPVVNEVFATSGSVDQRSAWLASLFFSGQIFCDFSGYSMCAIGIGMCLGFKLPINFRSPFAAIGFSDFWRRWHISLSSWLRDYLYIPLGGNRKGKRRTLINLMVTMFLGGLWHGAAWTFVIWGLLHGTYLVIERYLKQVSFLQSLAAQKFVQPLLALATFTVVMLTFVVFRASDMTQASLLFHSLFSGSSSTPVVSWNLWTQLVLASMVLLLAVQWLLRGSIITDVLAETPVVIRAVLLSLCLLLITIASGNSDAFIYFQF